MSLLKIVGEKTKSIFARVVHGSFSPTIFKRNTEITVYHILCFISVCPFVALLKAKFAENVHIKKRSFLTSYVF